MAQLARPSLFVRLTATFALAIALPFAGSAWFAMRNATNWIESEAERREQALAALAGNLTLATIERAEVKLATLARMVATAPMFSTPTDSQLLEAQVEPPDVFLELQNIDAGPGFAVNSQVQQRALPADLENDRLRALANTKGRAVQEPIATRLPWRSPQLETLRDVTTLAVSAPCLQDGVTRGVLVGYVDFKELRAAISRASGGASRVIVRDSPGKVLADTGSLAGALRSIRATIAGSDWSVEVSERREDIAAPLVALRKQIAGFGALGLLLALAAGSVLAARIARPIARLESAAKRMGAGDLAARSGVDGGDEIGRLGLAFDTMAAGFERLDTAKSAFVGNVSHELRTPLRPRGARFIAAGKLRGSVVGNLVGRADDVILEPVARRWSRTAMRVRAQVFRGGRNGSRWNMLRGAFGLRGRVRRGGLGRRDEDHLGCASQRTKIVRACLPQRHAESPAQNVCGGPAGGVHLNSPVLESDLHPPVKVAIKTDLTDDPREPLGQQSARGRRGFDRCRRVAIVPVRVCRTGQLVCAGCFAFKVVASGSSTLSARHEASLTQNDCRSVTCLHRPHHLFVLTPGHSASPRL